MKNTKRTVWLFLLVAITGCTGIPDGITPVANFEWYEIARLDHRFERGLSKVSATYSRREDGGIKVLNRGYNDEEKSWSEAEGRAYFTQTPDIGALKVSFFGPFFGAYNIFALDEKHYQWVMICGADRDFLWILSRKPSLEKETLDQLLNLASEKGFNTDKLIFPIH